MLALALPSTASAAFTVGISENQPSMFADPLFQGVGFKQARVIVGWDVALDPAGDEAARLRDYLAGGAGRRRRAAGLVPAHARRLLALRPEEELRQGHLQAADARRPTRTR